MWRQSSSQTIAAAAFGFVALGAAILADRVRMSLRALAAVFGIGALVFVAAGLL